MGLGTVKNGPFLGFRRGDFDGDLFFHVFITSACYMFTYYFSFRRCARLFYSIPPIITYLLTYSLIYFLAYLLAYSFVVLAVSHSSIVIILS